MNTKKEMDALWSARREAALVANAMKPEGTVMLATDVAVPISRMADLIGELSSKFSRSRSSALTNREQRDPKTKQIAMVS